MRLLLEGALRLDCQLGGHDCGGCRILSIRSRKVRSLVVLSILCALAKRVSRELESISIGVRTDHVYALVEAGVISLRGMLEAMILQL